MHLLQEYLGSNFSKEIFDNIIKISLIHKLTYKNFMSELHFPDEVKNEDAFAEYIIKTIFKIVAY